MRPSVLWLIGAILLAGCGGADKDKVALRGVKLGQERRDPAADVPAQAPAGQVAVKEKKKPEPRLIIYTGSEELIVEDVEATRKALEKLVVEYDGYISGSEMTGDPGQPRSGRWTLRIPVEKFKPFLDATSQLGEMRKQKLDSEDVTDQYFDVKASVTNLEVREEALRKLYKEKIGGTKLTDLLEVDRELNKVRGDIDQRKGQLQRWDKLVAFATLKLSVSDRKDYVPPESPDFGTSLGRTWSGSIAALIAVGKGLVYAAVALTPWVGVLAVLVAAVWIPIRLLGSSRGKGHAERAPQQATPADANEQVWPETLPGEQDVLPGDPSAEAAERRVRESRPKLPPNPPPSQA